MLPRRAGRAGDAIRARAQGLAGALGLGAPAAHPRLIPSLLLLRTVPENYAEGAADAPIGRPGGAPLAGVLGSLLVQALVKFKEAEAGPVRASAPCLVLRVRTLGDATTKKVKGPRRAEAARSAPPLPTVAPTRVPTVHSLHQRGARRSSRRSRLSPRSISRGSRATQRRPAHWRAPSLPRPSPSRRAAPPRSRRSSPYAGVPVLLRTKFGAPVWPEAARQRGRAVTRRAHAQARGGAGEAPARGPAGAAPRAARRAPHRVPRRRGPPQGERPPLPFHLLLLLLLLDQKPMRAGIRRPLEGREKCSAAAALPLGQAAGRGLRRARAGLGRRALLTRSGIWYGCWRRRRRRSGSRRTACWC
jgi:hypothetical protein